LKVIICGGRNYRLTRSDYAWLNGWFETTPGVTTILIGGARGVDTDAFWWAQTRFLRTQIFRPDWDTYGRSAGPRRNKAMVDDACPDGGLIAFPGGRGTADCVARAKRAGLKVWECLLTT